MATNFQIRQAVRVLHSGGVIAYPTETVYGLGCDPLDGRAVQRILDLKQRSQEKGLILIAVNLDQLLPFITVFDPKQLNKLAQINKRPTTWICPRSHTAPQWLSGSHNTIAVRISQHPIVQQLCQQFGGAIVSTSANPAGLAPACSMLMLRRYFAGQLDFSLGGAHNNQSQPSRIINLLSGIFIRS